MRTGIGFLALVFAVGCSETGVDQDVQKWADPNPVPPWEWRRPIR